MARRSGVFKFQKHDCIGFPAAENDSKFLNECFVDTGDLEGILDFQSPKAILRGRTGAGKSALLGRVAASGRDTISISPDQLAFNYITCASYIVEMEYLGINLTPFYKYLWRHVIAVEVLRHLYPDGENGNLFNRLLDTFRRSPNEKKAIEYLKKYANDYWLTEAPVAKEIVKHNEKEIGMRLRTDLAGRLIGGDAGAGLDRTTKYSITERQEIEKFGREWVSRSQTPLLSDLPSLLHKIFETERTSLYITIDALDEGWAEDQLRYKLLRALIGNVRDYNHTVGKLKILIALRQDLWTSVFRETQEQGQQEEKTSSLVLDLTWNREQLLEIMNRRINKMVRDRYTTAAIGFHDIFPQSIAPTRRSGKGSTGTLDYIIARTWSRPRDVIEFVNRCIDNATGKSVFNKTMLQSAERQYSESRFRSLVDEWQEAYPEIEHFVLFLKKRPSSFSLDSVPKSEWEELSLDYVCLDKESGIQNLCQQFFDGERSVLDFSKDIARMLYEIGAIGLKTDTHLEMHWRYVHNHVITSQEIPDTAQVAIHPALHRYLGCDSRIT